MRIVDIPISNIEAPPWNSNVMDNAARDRLQASIDRFGFQVPLTVREVAHDLYETVGGAQRLSVLDELGLESVPCVVVEVDDAEARLLAQALNHIHGEDDLGLQAENLRTILESHSQEEVLLILPETRESLLALVSLGEIDMAEHLQAWQAAQAARLKHMTIQLLPSQLETVEEALGFAMARATEDGPENPNRRGSALHSLCLEYLEFRKESL